MERNKARQLCRSALAVFIILAFALSLQSAETAKAPANSAIVENLLLFGSDEDHRSLIRVEVNLSDPKVTELGKIVLDGEQVAELEAMAWDPVTGRIFVISNHHGGRLLTIDPDDFLESSSQTDIPAQLVGITGSTHLDGIAINPVTGMLVGVDTETEQLVRIDKSTAAVETIGALGFENVEGLAFTPEFETTLFGIDNEQHRLLTIDPATGAATAVSPNEVGFSDVEALVFAPDGRLFGFSDDKIQTFITIDVQSGIATEFVTLGAESRDIEGLTFLKPDKLIPVELTHFNGHILNREIVLEWTTRSETENLGFYVFRSFSTSDDFVRLNQDMIRGAGNSSSTQYYRYVDKMAREGRTHYYRLADVDFNGRMTFHQTIKVVFSLQPQEYVLAQNYPNPFNPQTSIKFTIPEGSDVSLKIYNLQGQLVRTLLNGEQPAGSFLLVWDGMNERGKQVAAGAYLYELQVNNFRVVKRMIFLK